MNDKAFVDTNLLVYSISTDVAKAGRVERLLLDSFDFIISTQVVNEFVHTCHRKELLPVADIRRAVEDFLLFFDLAIIGESTILLALDIKERHSFSWYDALIVATALESDCSTLFSEDMHSGMIIEGKMTILNPFSI